MLRPALPTGACDCHLHVFGPAARYPLAPERAYTPNEASLESYRAVMDGLGIDRAVLVQPSVYGCDNRALLDALAEGGADFRGIVVIDPAGDDDLAALHAAGVRGLRVNRLFPGAVETGDIEALARRMAPLGWHLQVLMNLAEDPAAVRRLGDLPLPVVFDHLGHMPPGAGPDDAGFQALLGLLRDGAWVKLSAPYRLSLGGAPPYDDVRPLADAVLAAAPERVVWGSDWPHPAVAGPTPRPEDLLIPLLDWIGEAALQRRVLVDNPARLYGFA